MKSEREKKLFEFNVDDIPIGKCKTIGTEEGTFKICRGKKKIEIYWISVDK
jgi:hypothetical protein